MQKINVDLQIKSKVWRNIAGIENFAKERCEELILETELGKFLRKKENFIEIGVSLVSDAQIKKINHQFRGKNKATNILSFGFIDEKLIRKNGFLSVVEAQNFLMVGDLVLSLETIRRECVNSGEKFRDHLTHLLLHGILHLIGFDHEKDGEALVMEKLEVDILRKFNIENPYKLEV